MEIYNLAKKFIIKTYGYSGTGIQSIKVEGAEVKVLFSHLAWGVKSGDERIVFTEGLFKIIRKKTLFRREKIKLELISLNSK